MEQFDLNNFDENAVSTGISPMLDPGSHYVRFVDISLSAAPYDSAKTFIDITVEGPEVIVAGFKGFAIDKNNPSLGNFKGKVGFVKHDKFPCGDWTPQGGKFISGDKQVFNWLGGLAKWMGVLEEMRAKNIGVGSASIAEFTYAVSKFLCNPNKRYMMTLGGREYMNNKGYMSYQLFVPKANRGKIPVVPKEEEGPMPLDFQVYNELSHIQKMKEVAPTSAVAAGQMMPEGFAGMEEAAYAEPVSKAADLNDAFSDSEPEFKL